LLITGEKVDEAVSLAKKYSSLAVGLHLNLAEGKPITCKKEKIESLINEKGKFLDPKEFRKGIWKLRIKASHISTELENQIKEFFNVFNGLIPTHLDSHYHISNIPHVMRVVSKLAKQYKIRCIRKAFNLYIGEKGEKHHVSSLREIPRFMYKKWLNAFLEKNFTILIIS